jgi:hypothetical protein
VCVREAISFAGMPPHGHPPGPRGPPAPRWVARAGLRGSSSAPLPDGGGAGGGGAPGGAGGAPPPPPPAGAGAPLLKPWWETWAASWHETSSRLAAHARDIKPPDFSKGLGAWRDGAHGLLRAARRGLIAAVAALLSSRCALETGHR